jgi:hypothetical protein
VSLLKVDKEFAINFSREIGKGVLEIDKFNVGLNNKEYDLYYYLTKNISFDFNQKKQEGIKFFLESI